MVKRVALLFATSGHSGVDRVIRNLMPEFANLEYNFDILVIRKHGPHLESIPENMRIVKLPVAHKRAVLFPLIWYLHRHRPHTLLTANHQLNRAALIARWLTGVKTRICIRMGMSLTAKLENMRSGAQKRLTRSMRRWYPLADATIAPSKGVGRDLMQIAGVPEEQLHIIPNPIINNSLYEMAKAELSHSWFINSDVPVILGVGSLELRKDFSVLICAFAMLRKEMTSRLVILGEGKQRQNLHELAKKCGVEEDVDMPGFDSNPYRYMARADLFVLSSRKEGSPVVLVEALACDTQVVSTDCPTGPREILKRGEYGELFPVGDVEALYKAMLRCLSTPKSQTYLKDTVAENNTANSAYRYMQAMGLI